MHISALVEAQCSRRIAADPTLEQHIGGMGPDAIARVYAARSIEQAYAMHARKMGDLIRRRVAEDVLDPPPAHRSSPYCPHCACPCGTVECEEGLSHVEGWVRCGACGADWHDLGDYRQAVRADAAYAKHRDEEEQRWRDHARLGPELAKANARMLEQAEARRASWAPASQPSLFGAGP